MLRSSNRTRAGITLTEILISILIMGIGMVSLATLFPLGLLRLRDAQRWSRSKYLLDAAAADLEARNLLGSNSFSGYVTLPSGSVQWISPWYMAGGVNGVSNGTYYPWVQDTLSLGNPAGGVYRGTPTGAYSAGSTTVIPGPGLPVAYDPLWRYQANPTVIPNTNLPTGIYLNTNAAIEGRFGSGAGNLLNQADNNGGKVSAWGLPRVTNFDINQTYPVNGALSLIGLWGPNTVPDILVSHEDVVLQSDSGSQSSPYITTGQYTGASTIVPDLSIGAGGLPAEDWKFSWSFTGQLSDASNFTIYDGNIVIWENRPFGLTQVNGTAVPEGETVVEGVFGFAGLGGGTTIAVLSGNPNVGFARNANRSVLLRWPIGIPDPEVKVGSWIADVTYERSLAVQGIPGVPSAAGRWQTGDYPYQRCNWYQIVKRTEPVAEAPASGTIPAVGLGTSGTYRAMTVWVSTPLKAQTLLSASSGQPFHNNAALIAPNVVAVFPRVIYAH